MASKVETLTSTLIAEATGVLPVVSTLTFGIGVQCIFEPGDSSSELSTAIQLVLLCLSCSMSVYTTTFSLLEFCARPGRARARTRERAR